MRALCARAVYKLVYMECLLYESIRMDSIIEWIFLFYFLDIRMCCKGWFWSVSTVCLLNSRNRWSLHRRVWVKWKIISFCSRYRFLFSFLCGWLMYIRVYLIICGYVFYLVVPPKLNPFQSTVLQLNVGDRASLTCSVIKGDLPITITWRKDNRIIDASQHISIKQVDHYNSILVIDNLGPDHTSNYSCKVRNSAAEVEISQSLLVNGKHKQTHTHNLIHSLTHIHEHKHTHIWYFEEKEQEIWSKKIPSLPRAVYLNSNSSRKSFIMTCIHCGEKKNTHVNNL